MKPRRQVSACPICGVWGSDATTMTNESHVCVVKVHGGRVVTGGLIDPTDCEHRIITTWTDDEGETAGRVAMWACEACRLRFVPKTVAGDWDAVRATVAEGRRSPALIEHEAIARVLRELAAEVAGLMARHHEHVGGPEVQLKRVLAFIAAKAKAEGVEL